jgi:hypothetical protein
MTLPLAGGRNFCKCATASACIFLKRALLLADFSALVGIPAFLLLGRRTDFAGVAAIGALLRLEGAMMFLLCKGAVKGGTDVCVADAA